jgi:succinate dehydrogenase / fumarate reductase iron-sulfur subunit
MTAGRVSAACAPCISTAALTGPGPERPPVSCICGPFKDLVVYRSSFDRIIQAGGYISVNTGNAVDANSTPVEKDKADTSFAAATCIGCGACVAACKNSSALLFVSAKVSHLALLPQGGPERKTRVRDMIAQMDKEGFGRCTSTGACEAVCPKEISIVNIARLNAEYGVAGLTADQ